MKIDFIKLVSGIATAMSFVNKLKAAKGMEKADAVVAGTPDLIQALELNLDRDILVEEAVVAAERQMIAGIKNFYNAYETARSARVKTVN